MGEWLVLYYRFSKDVLGGLYGEFRTTGCLLFGLLGV